MLWEEGFAPDEESEDEDAYDDHLTEDLLFAVTLNNSLYCSTVEQN